jgi:CRISPR-associated exonuclease Cas4
VPRIKGVTSAPQKSRAADDYNSVQLATISGEEFSTWYQNRQQRQNIENGKPYFNGPPQVPEPGRHSPSRLLRCHRRSFYDTYNAPKETASPEGIFWFGSKFETDIAVPFLRDQTESDEYVRNSMWIDFIICCEVGDLRIRGETDPVVVDEESSPLLLTEIKTTSSITHLQEPKEQHLAQVHSYLYGLSEEYDCKLREAVILYAGREDFEVRNFHVEFDLAFWEDRVLPWAEQDTAYRQSEELPPATPEYDWECQYCPYRRRCGKEEGPHIDSSPTGLLPLIVDYPQEQLKTYLAAHPEAKLTPTLAHQFPELASEYGSYDWRCPACGSSYPRRAVDWDGDVNHLPNCPDCKQREIPVELTGPLPEE